MKNIGSRTDGGAHVGPGFFAQGAKAVRRNLQLEAQRGTAFEQVGFNQSFDFRPCHAKPARHGEPRQRDEAGVG